MKPKSDTSRIPHVGWNEVNFSDSLLYKEIPENSCFYFSNSYSFQEKNQKNVSATFDYDLFLLQVLRKTMFLGPSSTRKKAKK
jgi:imidazoleglycerol phosphate synthase glutamine amidotransferase subunit HisH